MRQQHGDCRADIHFRISSKAICFHNIYYVNITVQIFLLFLIDICQMRDGLCQEVTVRH